MVTKYEDFKNSRWWMTAISKIFFSHNLAADFSEILHGDTEWHVDSRHVT